MRKILILSVAAVALAGCSEHSRSDRALAGGAIGATSGAMIGGLSTGRAGGAVAGGIIGGVAGAIIGAETTPKSCVATNRRGRPLRDEYGEVVRVRCP